MSVVSNDVAWFATSGGVVRWPLSGMEAELHHIAKGLRNPDVASMVLDSSGTVWAISANGGLAAFSKSTNAWINTGSYGASSWTFTPRVAMAVRNNKGKDILVLGGAKGLTFFSPSDSLALDNVTRFSTLKQSQVYSLAVRGDTLWVGLLGGVARTIPNWNNLGKPGFLLSDPSRWTVIQTLDDTAKVTTLVATDTGLFVSTNLTQKTADLEVSSQALTWNGKTYSGIPEDLRLDAFDNILAPVHVSLWNGKALVSSNNADASDANQKTLGKGPLLLESNGTLRRPTIANSFPVDAPRRGMLTADGTMYAVSINKGFRLKPSELAWTEITPSPDRSFHPFSRLNSEFDSRNTTHLSIDSKGQFWTSTWGNGIWAGSPNESNPNWQHTTPSNSCLAGAEPGIPNFLTIPAIAADSTGMWAVNYKSTSDSLQLAYYPNHSTRDPRCFLLKATASAFGITQIFPDAYGKVWLATPSGLWRIDTSKIQGNAPVPTTTWKFASDDAGVQRITTVTIESKEWLLASGNEGILAIPVDAPDTAKAYSLSIDSLSFTAPIRALAVDGLNHVWLGGPKGISVAEIGLNADNIPSLFLKGTFRRIDGLPGDDVRDISIQKETGKALISTTTAVTLWTSPFRPKPEKLVKAKLRVWPNPVRTRVDKVLTVDGGTANASFYLHAMDGTLIAYLPPNPNGDGYFRWPIPSPKHFRPGVYRWTVRDGSTRYSGSILVGE
jgi:hypothetical protein